MNLAAPLTPICGSPVWNNCFRLCLLGCFFDPQIIETSNNEVSRPYVYAFVTVFIRSNKQSTSLKLLFFSTLGHLDDPIAMVDLDTSNGVMFPIYDADANLVYLCGKVRTQI